MWNWKQNTGLFYTCLSWRRWKTEPCSILATCRASRDTHSQVRTIVLHLRNGCTPPLTFRGMDCTCTLYNPSLQSMKRRWETKIHAGILFSGLQKAQFDFATPGIVWRQFSYFPEYWSIFTHCVSGEDPEYLITGTHAYPSGPGKYIILIKQLAYSSVIPV